jgi:hypothetical protein
LWSGRVVVGLVSAAEWVGKSSSGDSRRRAARRQKGGSRVSTAASGTAEQACRKPYDETYNKP